MEPDSSHHPLQINDGWARTAKRWVRLDQLHSIGLYPQEGGVQVIGHYETGNTEILAFYSDEASAVAAVDAAFGFNGSTFSA